MLSEFANKVFANLNLTLTQLSFGFKIILISRDGESNLNSVYILIMYLFTECDKPSAIDGATFDPNTDKINHNTKLKFSCNTAKYTPSGTSEVLCNEGSFPGIDFKCDPSKCPIAFNLFSCMRRYSVTKGLLLLEMYNNTV